MQSIEDTVARLLAMSAVLAAGLLLGTVELPGAPVPAYQTGDATLRDFHFQSGERLPEVRIHYVTFGTPRRDEHGIVRNAVLVLHGTTGSSAQFLGTNFAGQLFGAGQLLDAGRYFVIIPDNLGHGKSSKPSDGLKAHFPKYGYRDMVEAQFRM